MKANDPVRRKSTDFFIHSQIYSCFFTMTFPFLLNAGGF